MLCCVGKGWTLNTIFVQNLALEWWRNQPAYLGYTSMPTQKGHLEERGRVVWQIFNSLCKILLSVNLFLDENNICRQPWAILLVGLTMVKLVFPRRECLGLVSRFVEGKLGQGRKRIIIISRVCSYNSSPTSEVSDRFLSQIKQVKIRKAFVLVQMET